METWNHRRVCQSHNKHVRRLGCALGPKDIAPELWSAEGCGPGCRPGLGEDRGHSRTQQAMPEDGMDGASGLPIIQEAFRLRCARPTLYRRDGQRGIHARSLGLLGTDGTWSRRVEVLCRSWQGRHGRFSVSTSTAAEIRPLRPSGPKPTSSRRPHLNQPDVHSCV